MTIHLSRRLKRVASFIKGSCFADIGSDHAYLPCYLCLQDEQIKAVAGEIANAPFKSAWETVERYNLSDKVNVRYGDGLDVLKNEEVDSIVLAGMGGTLIKTILDDGQDRLNDVNRIIAQPNVGAPHVRSWLERHHYSITNEAIIEENGHTYEIIVADKGAVTCYMTEKQLLFGPHLLHQKSNAFYRKWYHEYAKHLQIMEQITQATEPDMAKLSAFKQEAAWIKEVLDNESDHTQQ